MLLSELRDDLKYAARMVRRAPAFSAVAVLMLALGTGVNVAMFSVIDAVMLRSPFPEPDRLVALQVSDRPSHFTLAIPPARFAELVANRGPFESVAATWGGAHVLTGAGDPFQPDVECQSASMFDVLGSRPLLGRVFTADEDRPGAPATAVLSHALWQRLGGAPSIIGSTVTLNQTPTTVVGVMRPDFGGPRSRSDVGAWVPLNRPIAGGGLAGCANIKLLNVFARLPIGMRLEAAQARLAGFRLLSNQEQTFGELRAPLLALSVAVAFVLLIACFNVSGLQMERMLARQRELSIRAALGATRGRLAAQVLIENVLLALLGAVGGVLASHLTIRTIVSLLPANVPHLNEMAINGRALGVTIAIAAMAAIVAGLVPTVLTRRADAASLASGARATERRRSSGRWTLVFAEVALSTAVLIGAGLMTRTFLTLRPSHPGFDASGKLMMAVRLPSGTPAASAAFFDQLFDRLHGAIGPRVAGTQVLPRIFGSASLAPVKFDETTRVIGVSAMTPEYLDLLRIPLIGGRSFGQTDTSTSTAVAIVNEKLARRIRSDGRVLGQIVMVGDPLRLDAPPTQPRVIVGVVGNTRRSGGDTLATEELYVPYGQSPSSNLVIVADDGGHAHAAIAAMRSAVRSVRPDLVVADPQPLVERLDRSVQFWRFGTWLLGAFAALAVLLALIGLATTMAWSVRERTREIGVRVALGATGRSIVVLMLRQGVVLAAAGIAAGWLAATGLTRYLESWLYGVTPLDMTTFGICAGVMFGAALVAVIVPAQRATTIDPAATLRAE